MPVLNVQLGLEGVTKDGQKLSLPPAFALLQRGPIVQVSVAVGQAIAEQLLQQGQQVPAPMAGIALIDTGATTTCIDDEVAQGLMVLIGRDVLQSCVLVYNGLTGQFSLSI